MASSASPTLSCSQKVGHHLLFFIRFIQLGSVAFTTFIYCYLVWQHNHHYCVYYPSSCTALERSYVQVPWESKIVIAAVSPVLSPFVASRGGVLKDLGFDSVHSRLPGELHLHLIAFPPAEYAKLQASPLHHRPSGGSLQRSLRGRLPQPIHLDVLLLVLPAVVVQGECRGEELCVSGRWIRHTHYCYVSTWGTVR